MTTTEKGSEIAKNGFQNEDDVVFIFNHWKESFIAKEWLLAMNYDLNEIEYVKAKKIKGSYKADIQVKISILIKLKKIEDIQNLQVKLVSNSQGFNQIDKRWVKNYKELWGFDDNVEQILKYFTGEIEPYKKDTKDKRRMFFNEMTGKQQQTILDFFTKNKVLILTDILKGRGKFSAEWMLVILKMKNEKLKWVLKPMNYCLNFFGEGSVEITKQGSLKIGKITMQRKGGDAGRKTAQMLQFKINPCLLFNE